MRSAPILERFNADREQQQEKLAAQIRSNMASLLVGADSTPHPTSDVLLVAADGSKLAAHLCILKQRAPVFYSRHIQPTLDAIHGSHTPVARLTALLPTGRRMGQLAGEVPLEVAIGDVDSKGLAFFLQSVYTEEEARELYYSRPCSHLSDRQSGQGGPDTDGERTDEDGTDRQTSKDMHSEQHRSPDLDSLNDGSTTRAPYHQQGDDYKAAPHAGSSTPIMTSFAELANLHSSLLPRPAFDSGHSSVEQMPTVAVVAAKEAKLGGRRQEGVSNERCSIFQMFVGIDGEQQECAMSQSFPVHSLSASSAALMSCSFAGSTSSIRSRVLAARKMSMSSTSSLASIDAPSSEVIDMGPAAADRTPACQLASDLLQMYLGGEDSDCVVVVSDGELKAHRSVLWASCRYMLEQLQHQIEGDTLGHILLTGFDKAHVHFLMCFLYGGITCIPDELDIWELVRIARELGTAGLTDVIALHLRAYKCHYFHRPCAGCVSAAFDLLPRLNQVEDEPLDALRRELLAWQALHFHRIWRGRVFMHLDQDLKRECFNALLESITEESVLDTLVGCEKLHCVIPRMRSQPNTQYVQTLVANTAEYCTEFLNASFDLLIQSRAFAFAGKGLALNLPMLENLLPHLIHNLTTEVAIKAYLSLQAFLQLLVGSAELLKKRDAHPPESPPTPESNGELRDTWNPRFIRLVRRLYHLVDRHLLHHAAAAVRSDAWPLLQKVDQERIREAGIFVEMKMPKVAIPPNLSSSLRRSSPHYVHELSDGHQTSVVEAMTQHAEGAENSASIDKASIGDKHGRGKVEGRKDGEQTLPGGKLPLKDRRYRRKDEETVESSSTSSEKPERYSSKIPRSMTPLHTSTQSGRRSLDGRDSQAGGRIGSQPHDGADKQTEVREELPFLRQNTHTVMTAQQNRDAGVCTVDMTQDKLEASSCAINSPSVFPISGGPAASTKPRSIVRPMPKADARISGPAKPATPTIRSTPTIAPKQRSSATGVTATQPPITSARAIFTQDSTARTQRASKSVKDKAKDVSKLKTKNSNEIRLRKPGKKIENSQPASVLAPNCPVAPSRPTLLRLRS